MKLTKSQVVIFEAVVLLLFATGCASNAVPGTGISASDEIYVLKEVDQTPRPRGQRAEPIFPLALKAGGITGEVVIELVVNTKGKTEQVRVLQATHVEFGRAAKIAVEQWQFTPAMKGDRLVNCRMQIPIAFRLQQ